MNCHIQWKPVCRYTTHICR